MAIVKLVCTRKVENNNVTFGKGKLGALTLTGDIYDAEDYKALFIDPDTGIPVKADLSASLIKCVGTVSFAGNSTIYEAIQQQVEDYFEQRATNNIFQIKVGIVVKSSAVSKPVPGVHPTLGTETLTVLINNATLIDVEEPELLEMADELVESTTQARENAKERSATGLAAYLVKKTQAAMKEVEAALFSEDSKTTKTTKKQTATK
jgi:hypothetical protein